MDDTKRWSVEREYNTIMVSDEGVPVCTLDGPVSDNAANANLAGSRRPTLQCGSCQMFGGHDPECTYHPENISLKPEN